VRLSSPKLPRRDARYSLALMVGAAAVALVALVAQDPLCFLGLGSLAFLAYNHLVLRRPFFPYDRILSAVSEDGLVWRREPGVRVDVGGLHHSRQVYQPAVVPLGGGFRMYYRAGGYRSVIVSAFSKDGITWEEEQGIRVDSGDARHLRIESQEVIALDSNNWRIYYASFDGNHWRLYCRRSANLCDWEEEQCCLDLSAMSEPSEAIEPAVIFTGSEYRLFFTGFSAYQQTKIYTARSSDGLRWVQVEQCRGCTAEGTQIRTPCVVRQRSGKWRMYYAERPPSTVIGSRIVSAYSGDGIEWQREPGVRLAPGGGFDQHGVFCPEVTPWEGGWRMYYGGYWGRHWLEPFTLWVHRQRGAGYQHYRRRR